MTKQRFLWLLIESAATFGLVYWLVGGSLWLDFFLSGAMANAAELYRRERRNRSLFDIADAELVRVSALANNLEERVIELEAKLAEAQTSIGLLGD